MSTVVQEITVEDIVQKVLGSRLKVAVKDKQLLQKQRKKVNKSIYLKQEKTLTQKQFIENYQLQDCNMKLQERLRNLKKKYQKQMSNYRKSQRVNQEIEKVKQKLNQISKQNMRLQKKLDKVRVTKIKLTSRENTLNLCSASSQNAKDYTYRQANSKSPAKNGYNLNQSLQDQRKNKQIQPFLINSQEGNLKYFYLTHQNKSVQTDYYLNKKQQANLLKQLSQKKLYIQKLKKIVESQETFIKTYELDEQQQSKRKTGLHLTKVKGNKNQNIQGKIMSLTKRVNNRNDNQTNKNNVQKYIKNTKDVSEFIYQEDKTGDMSPIAGTIIKVTKCRLSQNIQNM